MQKLNLQTVENLIFENKDVQKLLPAHMSNYFEQWRMAKQIPVLRQMGKKAMIDFLAQLDDEHVLLLENYFNDRIFVERLNYRSVENYKIPLTEKDICEELCQINSFPYFSLWRDNEHLYISFWR